MIKEPIKILRGEHIELRLLQENDNDFAQKFFDIVDADREYFRPYDCAIADPTCIKNVQDLAGWMGGMIQPERNLQERISYAIYFGDVIVGMLTLEISYFTHTVKPSVWISPKCESKGLASEALRLACDLAFDHYKLHRINSGCYVENIASIKLHEKVGFKDEGIERESIFDAGTKKYHSLQKYGLLVTDLQDSEK